MMSPFSFYSNRKSCKISCTQAMNISSMTSSPARYAPPKEPSPYTLRVVFASIIALGTIGQSLDPAGISPTTVKENASNQLACEGFKLCFIAIAWTDAESHQSYQLSLRAGSVLLTSCKWLRTGLLPPCPFSTRIRLKPCPYAERTISSTAEQSVAARRLKVPGYARK